MSYTKDDFKYLEIKIAYNKEKIARSLRNIARYEKELAKLKLQENAINELIVFEIPNYGKILPCKKLDPIYKMFPSKDIISCISLGMTATILVMPAVEQKVLQELKGIWPDIVSKKMTMIPEIIALENGKTMVLKCSSKRTPCLCKYNDAFILLNTPIKQFLDCIYNNSYTSIEYEDGTYDI